MENKLKLLLEQINFEDKNEYFKEGILDKIVGNKDKTKYNFYITTSTNIPLSQYLELKEKLQEKYNQFEKVDIYINVKKENQEIIKEYYEYFIDTYSTNSPLTAMFKDKKIEYKDNILTLELDNKAEELKLNGTKKDLENDFEKVGYKLNITTVVNNENGNKIMEEIKEELNNIELPEIKEEPKEEIKNETKYSNYKRPPLISDKTNDKIVVGKIIDDEIERLDTVVMPGGMTTIEVELFGKDVREAKSGLKIITLKLTDYTDSIYATLFVHNQEEFDIIDSKLKVGSWFKIRATVKDKDQYNQDISLLIRDINTSDKKIEKRIDDAPVKRVELHAHTMMSQMDGVTKLDLNKHTCELVERCIDMGYKGVAITDHNGCQAFPISFGIIKSHNKKIKNKIKDAIKEIETKIEECTDPKEKETLQKELETKQEKLKNPPIFKGLYGTELTLVDDTVDIVIRPTDDDLLNSTYVVFDTETTGFNAGGADQMIEIGAVKLQNGEIIDRFDELINPQRHIPEKITELTLIDDDMVKDKDNEEVVTKRFLEWVGDLPMVAHNAKFDISFLTSAMKKYDLGEFTNTVIDTLELSRTLDQGYARHGLSALVKRYNVPWDEEAHHRADYDAEGTALVFSKMIQKLEMQKYEKISDLDRLISKDEIHKFGRTFHFNAIALNKTGLKNLFKIISLANTTYLYKTPRILRSKLNELREGLLIGSGCYESEIFNEARSKEGEELSNLIDFYDYVEVQPVDVYNHLLQTNDFKSEEEIKEHLKKIINTTIEAGKIIVATGDVHHFDKEDKIYRKIIVNQKVPGGGRHPLAKKDITEIPSQHFRTTREMLEDFSFLGSDLAYQIVVENTNKILDMTEEIEVIIDTGGVPFSPKIENSDKIVNDMVYEKAKELYGDPLPELISERIEQELKGIIGGGFDVIYLIAQKLVKKSNDDGYLVGSRGSVGSSFVATMMGITEVNPLPAHYRCPKCKHSIFEENGETLGSKYNCGFDLPDKKCPKCNETMVKDGQDMPFATFLGFNADKVPDIDLNFSDLNQADAHEYTKVLFGVDNVYRAGTIGTVADKTAFGFVKGYCEDNNIIMRTAEVERLAKGCTGVKRTTGQHPGGIVVIPGYMDVFDFTPFQYPAEDVTSAWRTTHFDYHAIDEDVLKLDILGHSDPTQLRMIQDLTGTDVTKVPMDDKETMKIFLSPEPLGVTKEQIMCNTGTLGIPEFGTKFTIQLVEDTKPTTFAELVKISGLSHGTDVWLGNAQELIKKNVVPFSDVIGCRDDIMVYLMYNGVEPIKAFKIMEFVRKGKASKDKETWSEYVKIMNEANIPKWFIDSCQKIKYMFPKAHAAAYVISAFRIAWYKVHMPVYYYASWLSTKATDFNVDAMIKGYDAIKNAIIEISNKGKEATNKDAGISESLYIALEATARGIKFENVNLYKSEATTFGVKDENTIYPPFSSIDGLGDTVAKNIVNEREKRDFISIEDLQKRCKISSTLIDKMRMMGILDGMEESSQLSLF